MLRVRFVRVQSTDFVTQSRVGQVVREGTADSRANNLSANPVVAGLPTEPHAATEGLATVLG